MTISSKVIDSMKLFAETYAKSTNTFFCSDLEVTESVIKGLANIKNNWAPRYAHVVIMIIKKMKLV